MHKCAFQKRKVVEEVAPLIASYNFNNVGKLCKKSFICFVQMCFRPKFNMERNDFIS